MNIEGVEVCHAGRDGHDTARPEPPVDLQSTAVSLNSAIPESASPDIVEEPLPQRSVKRGGRQPERRMDAEQRQVAQPPAPEPDLEAARATAHMALRPRQVGTCASNAPVSGAPAASTSADQLPATTSGQDKPAQPQSRPQALRSTVPRTDAPSAAGTHTARSSSAAGAAAAAVKPSAPARTPATEDDPARLVTIAAAAALAAAQGSVQLAVAAAARPRPAQPSPPPLASSTTRPAQATPRRNTHTPSSSRGGTPRTPRSAPATAPATPGSPALAAASALTTPTSSPSAPASGSRGPPPASATFARSRLSAAPPSPLPATSSSPATANPSATAVPAATPGEPDPLLVSHSRLVADREVLTVEVRQLRSQVEHLRADHAMLHAEVQRLLSQNTCLNTELASVVTHAESQSEILGIMNDAVRSTVLVDELDVRRRDLEPALQAAAAAGGKEEERRGMEVAGVGRAGGSHAADEEVEQPLEGGARTGEGTLAVEGGETAGGFTSAAVVPGPEDQQREGGVGAGEKGTAAEAAAVAAVVVAACECA